MYKTIIELKNDIPKETLHKIQGMCDRAFNNRAGMILSKRNNPYCLVFEGDEKDYGCLQLGVLSLHQTDGFKNHVVSWSWLDEDPDECCDILRELAVPVH
jgi:hypothetical protein